jgi:hypothetical protein
MKKFVRKACLDAVCLLVAVSLVGCEMQWSAKPNPLPPDGRLLPEVAKVIEEQWSVVGPYLEQELAQQTGTMAGRSWSDIQASEIVALSMEEQDGKRYVGFCHRLAYGGNPSEVLEAARSLVDEASFNEMADQVESLERGLHAHALSVSRTLPPNQRAPFLRDLQKLVTKTVVLLVAGVVYACIPTTVFWGKITAAAALSVAAGIVATSVLSIYRYYKYGADTLAMSFQEWIVDVTTDPAAAYAMASSMMTVGKTLANGPVVTGLVIAVFAIYQVIDMVKPMLKKYNFDA